MTKTRLENWKCSPVSLTMSQRSQNSLNVFAIVFVFVFAIVFVFAFVFFGFNFSKVFPFSVPEYFLPAKKTSRILMNYEKEWIDCGFFDSDDDDGRKEPFCWPAQRSVAPFGREHSFFHPSALVP